MYNYCQLYSQASSGIGHDAGMADRPDRGAQEEDGDVALVIEQELALLQPGVRSSPEAVRGLLHESFREFGASGRIWGRDETVAALADSPGPGAEAEDLRSVRIGNDVILLTYVARRPDRRSLRNSLWVRGPNGWRLFFHQGTVCE